ncbi:MAG: hypothetical protein M1816_007487 [Peltula sp. TS41687]|nr:MAG: hypothetical protein M1816_007487 [Peltula sp. TS41687]
MSRRPPNPVADRAAQNQQTLKSLVKLEGNKSCADCKRNKHPRWASWNLGVFVCIRCSGIHRGMGTHISRVKSVDLDAWTDEQMQSILRWGNTRANKYWEAKLAPGHVPSEAKIENFIRTKYESKRWVMDGEMPDPSTLDGDGDEDVPLGMVQETRRLDRSGSTRASPSASQPTLPTKPATNVDLFGDDTLATSRSSVTPPASRQKAQSVNPEPSRIDKPGESLLGLDFLGSSNTQSRGAEKPANALASNPGSRATSRPDLKQSILSLYSSNPRPSPQSSSAPPTQPGALGTRQPLAGQSQGQSLSGLHDAFSGLNFSASSSSFQERPTGSSFPPFGDQPSQKSPPAAPQLTSPAFTGGGLFDLGSKTDSSISKPGNPLHMIGSNSTPGSALHITNSAQVSSNTKPNSDMGAPFDLSDSSSAQFPPKQPGSSSGDFQHSVFNLSGSQSSIQTKPQGSSNVRNQAAHPTLAWTNTDPWASNDAWSSKDATSTQSTVPSIRASPPKTIGTGDLGWGSGGGALGSSGSGLREMQGAYGAPANPPKISEDEDFGGWSSAMPSTTSAPSKPAGGSSGTGGGGITGNDDLFSNVWE